MNIGKLIVGICALLIITFMTFTFGVGGFFFTLAIYGIIIWSLSD